MRVRTAGDVCPQLQAQAMVEVQDAKATGEERDAARDFQKWPNAPQHHQRVAGGVKCHRLRGALGEPEAQVRVEEDSRTDDALEEPRHSLGMEAPDLRAWAVTTDRFQGEGHHDTLQAAAYRKQRARAENTQAARLSLDGQNLDTGRSPDHVPPDSISEKGPREKQRGQGCPEGHEVPGLPKGSQCQELGTEGREVDEQEEAGSTTGHGANAGSWRSDAMVGSCQVAGASG
mmetsp:Transcript_8140/g.22667  ORF Transcript_8140/g.22667 Transcript_8140/m.22667 type:complete len:231 (-) Transcript_8140:8-700(-)